MPVFTATPPPQDDSPQPVVGHHHHPRQQPPAVQQRLLQQVFGEGAQGGESASVGVTPYDTPLYGDSVGHG
jgi:hypothetical protein